MKNTVTTFQQMKEKGEKISMLTAYDYSTARLVDEAGVNSILVGDSLGNVMLGYEDTIAVTVEDMIHHGRAVARGAKNALVVVDGQRGTHHEGDPLRRGEAGGRRGCVSADQGNRGRIHPGVRPSGPHPAVHQCLRRIQSAGQDGGSGAETDR